LIISTAILLRYRNKIGKIGADDWIEGGRQGNCSRPFAAWLSDRRDRKCHSPAGSRAIRVDIKDVRRTPELAGIHAADHAAAASHEAPPVPFKNSVTQSMKFRMLRGTGVHAMRTFIATAALLLCSIWTFSVSADPCDASKELDERILACGDNNLAPQYGRECLAIIKQEGEATFTALQKAEALRNSGTLNDAISHAAEQIKTMEVQANNVAAYADVMIDFPDSKGPETSAECFNTNFDELSRVVWEMDDELIRAKGAYKSAVGVRDHLGK